MTPTPPTPPERDLHATILVKVVPGARRDEIAGMLGERLKIRVSAPPEGGKANQAVCRLIADSLGLKVRQVAIRTGHSNPEKTVEIHGMDDQQVRAILKLHDQPR